jgi:acetolactate synthase-1/2/3 large subunit
LADLPYPDLLAQALKARGVTHAFGMPGGATLPYLEAFRAVGIDFVLVRHEGAAGFMADAAFHITRSPGVCIATLGPGATNLVSGVAGSLLERSKVVAIVNQVGTDIRDRYTHQILDQVALFRPVAKRVVHANTAMAAMQTLTALATLDRHAPGPVVLDIPAEVTSAVLPDVDAEWGLFARPKPVPDISAAAELLRSARRPLVVVGCGELSIAAANGVRRLIQSANAASLTTYRAAGMVDDTHPLWGGTFGLSPVVDAHQRTLFEQADLMVAVGLDIVELRPQWLPGWPEDLPIVSIDAFGQPDLLGCIMEELTGPVMETLDALREAAFGPLPEDDPDAVQHDTDWTADQLDNHRQIWSAPFDDGPDGPAATIRAVQAGSPEGTRISLDVGAHRITASHVLRAHTPNQILQSNGFSSMGTGLPGAITSRLVDPKTPAVALTGDAGLWMTLGELGIVQERQLDLVVVYLADTSLSLIQLKQERLELPDHGVTFANPQVEPLARAFGGVGVSVQGAEAVQQAVQDAHARGGLTIIEARIDPRPYRSQM